VNVKRIVGSCGSWVMWRCGGGRDVGGVMWRRGGRYEGVVVDGSGGEVLESGREVWDIFNFSRSVAVPSRIQRKLETLTEANLDHKEKGKLLRAELSEAKKEMRREARARMRKDERGYHSMERRLLVLAGVWVFDEMRRGGPSASRLEADFVRTFAARAAQKDKDFVAGMLSQVLEKRVREKQKKDAV
jgi:hypothetical protein